MYLYYSYYTVWLFILAQSVSLYSFHKPHYAERCLSVWKQINVHSAIDVLQFCVSYVVNVLYHHGVLHLHHCMQPFCGNIEEIDLLTLNVKSSGRLIMFKVSRQIHTSFQCIIRSPAPQIHVHLTQGFSQHWNSLMCSIPSFTMTRHTVNIPVMHRKLIWVCVVIVQVLHNSNKLFWLFYHTAPRITDPGFAEALGQPIRFTNTSRVLKQGSVWLLFCNQKISWNEPSQDLWTVY